MRSVVALLCLMQLAAKHHAQLGGAPACHWAAILEQMPCWAAVMAEARPHAPCALAAAVARASPFTPHHLRLLRALLALRAVGEAPRRDAAQTLRLRLHPQPTAVQPAAASPSPAEPDEAHPIVTLFGAAGGGTRAASYSAAVGVQSVTSEDVAGLLAPSWLLHRLPEPTEGHATEAALLQGALELLVGTPSHAAGRK